MCGRSSLTKTEQELEKRFEASFYSDELERYNPIPNYNMAPSQFGIIIKSEDTSHFSIAKWGLIPSWSKNMSQGSKSINARKESLLHRKSFKNILKSQRCIIPLDGYYEWKKLSKKESIPYRLSLSNNDIFCVAGLWDKWLDDSGNLISSYTIITQEAPSHLAHIHNRVPAILTKSEEKMWLDNGLAELDILNLIQAPREGLLTSYPISTKVNSVKNNDASIILPHQYSEPGEQLRLFT